MENHIRDIRGIFIEERTKVSFANKFQNTGCQGTHSLHIRIQGKWKIKH